MGAKEVAGVEGEKNPIQILCLNISIIFHDQCISFEINHIDYKPVFNWRYNNLLYKYYVYLSLSLYNLDNDLSERHDLSKIMPERVDKMTKSMNRWKEELSEPQWKEGAQWFDTHSKNHIRIINGDDYLIGYPKQ